MLNALSLFWFQRTAGVVERLLDRPGDPGSPLREPLNRALLKIITKDDWLRLVEYYLGPDR